MEKPTSLSIKDFLIRNLSTTLMIDELTITRVINHQMEMAIEAMKTEDSVEFSGFCKFYFNRKKAYKRLEKMYSQKSVFENIMNDDDCSSIKRNSARNKLANILKNIEELTKKLDNETPVVTDNGGMEEHIVPPSEI